jgi:hypothetical protein
MIRLINAALIILLLLLLRQLIWCLRWLWCYYHGRPVPEPIGILPRRSGETFRGHLPPEARDELSSEEAQDDQQNQEN